MQCPLEVMNLHPSRDVAVLDFSYKCGTSMVHYIWMCSALLIFEIANVKLIFGCLLCSLQLSNFWTLCRPMSSFAFQLFLTNFFSLLQCLLKSFSLNGDHFQGHHWSFKKLYVYFAFPLKYKYNFCWVEKIFPFQFAIMSPFHLVCFMVMDIAVSYVT